MEDAITQRRLNRIEQRDHLSLPTAWVSAKSTPNWADGEWLRRANVRIPPSPNTPLLVMLGADSADARAELLAHAREGARVYVLVGSDWSKGKGQADTQVLEAPRVLIRRLPEVPATAVYAGAEAWLGIGGGFALRLDAEQAEALRLTFLRLFWHEATEETWSGGRQLEWHKAGERPFDVLTLPPSALVRWEAPAARLTSAVDGSLLHLNDHQPPAAAPARLWLPAGSSHHKALAKLKQGGVEVSWTARGLPDIAIDDSSGEVLLPGKQGRLRVRLVAAQIPEVRRLLEAPAEWCFQVDVVLGDARVSDAQLWLSGEATPRGLEEEQQIEVPPIRAASLGEIPQTSPPSWPDAQPLALAVRYQWTVLPPALPAGASRDLLIGLWQKVDDEWAARLKLVRDQLRNAEENRGRIKRTFTRLVSAALGFERTHSERIKSVDKLDAQRPSAAGPTRARELFTQLATLEQDVLKLKTDQEEAERKAREDEERERQQAAWQRQVDDAKRVLPERRKELADAENSREQLKEEQVSVEEALKTADKKEKRDLKVKQKRIADDLTRSDKEVARLRGELERLEQQERSVFEFRPPSQPSAGRPAQAGARFVPNAPSTRSATNVPEEALPEVGELYYHKGQRYLVIRLWRELDAGEQAADRLNAKLVAPENT